MFFFFTQILNLIYLSDPRGGGSAPSETCLDRAEKSKMLRDRGNKSYSRKEMHAALAFYSQAIVAAPVNSRETALALGISLFIVFADFLYSNILLKFKYYSWKIIANNLFLFCL
jgi:hypothetical protein